MKAFLIWLFEPAIDHFLAVLLIGRELDRALTERDWTRARELLSLLKEEDLWIIFLAYL